MLERCPVARGGSILEIGCGTGKLLAEMAALTGAGQVVGIDPDPGMLAQATGLETRIGSAEHLPVESDTIDLAYLSLAFHLVEQRRAARELHRVVRVGGYAAIWTLTPEHVTGYHLNRVFPSLTTVDLPRFQPPERWLGLLAGAGFEPVLEQQLVTERHTTAGALAAAVRGKFISTLALLPEDEWERGSRQLEAEAARDPDRRVSHTQIWCLLWGRRAKVMVAT